MSEQGHKLKEDTRYLPCLLRRLTDFDPSEHREVVFDYINIKQLKKDVFDNLEMILNSRSHPHNEDIGEDEEVKKSVLCFGVSDFCGRMSSQDSEEEIREEILNQILLFEPRLDPETLDVSFHETEEERSSVMEFQIQGQLRVKELSEEVVFISKLDLETGSTVLKNIRE